MSREAKIFNEEKKLIPQRVKEYECFGWELLSISNDQVSMTRETQNPIYPELVKYEFEYELLREKRNAIVWPKVPEFFSLLVFLILFLLLVLPAVFYVIIKISQMKNYKIAKQKTQDEYDAITLEIKKVLELARANFFGRQSS